MIRCIFIYEDVEVTVPEWVVDLEAFRRWGREDDFPEKANISYLRDEVWVDLSREQIYTHNQVKGEISAVLRELVNTNGSGRFFSWGAYLSNVEADFSHKPDGTFVSFERLRDGRVKIVETNDELEGSPEMVLEVVSSSTVETDNKVLREDYFLAGIREYWLVDARKPPLKFEILRRGRSGFVAGRKRGEWTRSEVFGHAFRLIQSVHQDGHPDYTLESQECSPN